MKGSFPVRTLLKSAAGLAALLAAAGCGDSPSSPAEPVYYTSICRNAVIIPENDSCFLYRRSGGEYTIFSPDTIPGLRPWRVITGSGLGGYVRRVNSIARDGRMLILQTAPAVLTDVVRRGRVEATIPAGLGAGGRVDLSGLSFRPSGGLEEGEVRIAEGYVEFNPSVEISLSILERTITGFEAIVSGPAAFSLELEAGLPEAFDWSGGIGLVTLRRRIDLMFDAAPLVVDIDITLEARVEGKGRFYEGCSFSCFSSGVVLQGAEYREGLWTEIDMTSFDHKGGGMTCASYADGTITLSVKPSIAVSFHGENSLSIGLSSSIRADAVTQAPPVWWWDLSALRTASFRFDPLILGGGMTGFESSRADTALVLSGPYRNEDFIFVLSLGGEEGEDDYLINPAGIATGGDGAVYVSDKTGHCIKKFSPGGEFISSWGSFGEEPARMSFPSGLACAPGGDVYLADSGNHRIQRFTPGGAFVSAWGSNGSGPGQFVEPQGIAFSPDGSVYVSDSYTCLVQKFTADGGYILGWGGPGTRNGLFMGPMGITCDGDGFVYVSECYNHRVQKFASDGAFVSAWGSAGTNEGFFNCPTGIAAGSDGRIFTVDYGNDRVQIFTAAGLPLSTLGFGGSGDGGFDGPFGIAVSANGDLFVTDSGNHRVQRFAAIIKNE